MKLRNPILFTATACLAFGQTSLPDFSNLSLDELANVKVTSFTKKEQKLSQVAGAVYVITREQIERSGLTSVPELLRLAPGVDVGQANGNQWSVSIRGTEGVYSNKLLVLIDGRSIYSPVFSGVYWDLGMPLLDDIDRIEVIRGPGATIWGANAVLGVINIITKNARETHGETVAAGGGTSERAFGSASIGGAAGSVNYRVSFGGFDKASLSQASGASAGDQWSSMQGGFRLDGSHNQDTWMLEGGLFRAPENSVGVAVSLPAQSLTEGLYALTDTAGNITGEWRRHVGESGEFRVSSWYDYVNQPERQASDVETHTGELSLQYDLRAGRHNLSVGSGERTINFEVASQGMIVFDSPHLTYANLNGFAQDEMHFRHDAVLVTLGAKLEHNHFGGWGTEPSANLLWMPQPNQSLWISAARSLRTPSIEEEEVFAPYNVFPGSPATGGLPIIPTFVGSPLFRPETVQDFEAGYRAQLSKRFSADVALFYDQFGNMRSFSTGNPILVSGDLPWLELPQITGNAAAATGKGGETSIAWQILHDWKLQGSYSYNVTDSWVEKSAAPGTVAGDTRQGPRNKWGLQSYLNLSRKWQLDAFLYWMGQASPAMTYGPYMPLNAYTKIDVRIAYKVSPHWQVSAVGQNLLQPRHLEAMPDLLTASTYVNRGVYLKSTWHF